MGNLRALGVLRTVRVPLKYTNSYVQKGSNDGSSLDSAKRRGRRGRRGWQGRQAGSHFILDVPVVMPNDYRRSEALHMSGNEKGNVETRFLRRFAHRSRREDPASSRGTRETGMAFSNQGNMREDTQKCTDLLNME